AACRTAGCAVGRERADYGRLVGRDPVAGRRANLKRIGGRGVHTAGRQRDQRTHSGRIDMAVQHTAQGNGAPASTPPSRNAHYLDEATGDVYIAVGTSGPEDWKKMLGAEEADAKYQQQGDYVSPGALNTALEEKVDTVPGKGLSTEDYTTAEKQKLAGLEGSHFRGTFLSLSALQAGATGPVPGGYADVDAGVGASVARYVWDDSDGEWVAQGGSADPLTSARVKTLYESNPDTNAFTDAEKQKLSDLPPGGGGSDDTIIEDFRSAS